MNAFHQLLADARDKLSAREGSQVSWREVHRRSGWRTHSNLMYHISPETKRKGGQHLVPLDLLDALERVLPLDHAELHWAAAVAAGFDVPRPGNSLLSARAEDLRRDLDGLQERLDDLRRQLP